jgi:predicted phage baseplate assembly protein
MKNPEICRDQEERRRDIRKHTDETGRHDRNGIDYLEVGDPQTELTVYFLGEAPANITKRNIRIDGGVRIRNIQVKDTGRCDPKDPQVDGCLKVYVDRAGDFSTYTLRLVQTDAQGRPGNEPLEGFDPRYAQIDFTFKAGCPTDLDCLPESDCPPAALDEPEIDYLAKDYGSFRQLILDRLSLIMPDWKERHVPDLGIALVEVLAYAGDYLSYYQDAVATEAYLETARQRISVRRHAKLVDYQMHEGCNARAWVYVAVEDDTPLGMFEDVYFISSGDFSLGPVLTADDLRGVPAGDYEVFEPIIEEPNQPLPFYAAHNNISFYTWHDRECCLPRGATSATLVDKWTDKGKDEPPVDKNSYDNDAAIYRQSEARMNPGKGQKRVSRRAEKKPKKKTGAYDEPDPQDQTPPPPPPRGRSLHLKAGDVLIFEEVLGPITGQPADADRNHRHVVRLTRVKPGIDTLYDQPILEIEWAVEDALPFPLCISAIGRAPECRYLTDVSIAHGNVLLVDHGRQVGSIDIEDPEFWTVPAVAEEDAGCLAEGEPLETFLRAGKFQARLKLTPLTHRAPFPSPSAVARQQSQLLSQMMVEVRARVEQLWKEVRDGRSLTAEEIAEIRTIFGNHALALNGQIDSDEQARLLAHLLEHEERLLASKARRVRSLAARARAGYVLRETEQRELAEMFGQSLVASIGIASSQRFGPASGALMQDPREAQPCIFLTERYMNTDDAPEQTPARWTPQLDLLESSSEDRDFVVETDNYGRAHLRFGDGDLGRAPIPNTILNASYRVGNGARGNVGAETITHFVFRKQVSGVRPRVRNPLPAQGGIDPEPVTEAKLFAPMAFRGQLERAVTRDDYAFLAQRSSPAKIQRTAAAPLRWTGGWYEVQVAIDPLGSEELTQDLRKEIEGYLYRYRRIGHDLRVEPAKYVSLDVVLSVCVLPHYLRGEVKAALLDLFSNRDLPGGKRGLFHPDNLSFGEGIYLSKLVAAAQGVTGVESVQIADTPNQAYLKLERLYEGPNQEIESGVLALGPLEVARLDSNRSLPENGRLLLNVKGGR